MGDLHSPPRRGTGGLSVGHVYWEEAASYLEGVLADALHIIAIIFEVNNERGRVDNLSPVKPLKSAGGNFRRKISAGAS